MGFYDTAQVCKNGHAISGYYNKYPDHRQAFCDKCGEVTITQCENCGNAIRGGYHFDGPVVPPPYQPPNYCHACGRPYPWTIRKIEAAKEFADDLDELTLEDRDKLKKSLDDITVDTPKTEVAATRFKRIMTKVGKESATAMKTIVTDVLCEAAKKTIFGP
ncbi:MAG: DUF2321 domain-containing protein [Limisphaerales bacterium]